MATYEYLIISGGRFLVKKRWVTKRDKKPHMKEYRITYKAGSFMCDCPGWNFCKKKPKQCKHTRALIAELKRKDMGILRKADRFDLTEFDWNKVMYYTEGQDETNTSNK